MAIVPQVAVKQLCTNVVLSYQAMSINHLNKKELNPGNKCQEFVGQEWTGVC